MNVSDICSIDSEAGIIATLFHHPEFCFYSESLLPNHFTDKTNRLIYTAICELARSGIKNVDSYNICEVLNAKEATRKYADSLSIDKLQELEDMSDILSRNSVEEYQMLVRNVMDTAFRRDTYNKLKECQTLCFDMNVKDLEQKVYEAIDDVMIEFNTTSDIPLFKDVVDEIWEEVEARQRGETEAIEFPFSILNNYVTLEPGEAVCIAAPQKAGKSAMLLTCTVDMLRKGKSVLYVDSEISTKLFTIRLMSHLTGIKFGKIRSGNYSLEEAEAIKDAMEWMKTRKFIHIYTPVLNADALYLVAKKAKHMIDIDCIVLDYLKADGSKDQAYEVYANLGNVSDILKNKIAGEMGIAALTACQTTSTGKIADSARIARSMSTTITITDKTIEEIESESGRCGTKKLRVLYNRNGAQMDENTWIDMDFDGSTCMYYQAEHQHIVEEPY